MGPLIHRIEERQRCFFPGRVLDLANRVLKNVREQKINSALKKKDFFVRLVCDASFFLSHYLPCSSVQVAHISELERLNDSEYLGPVVLVDNDVHGGPCFCARLRLIEKKLRGLNRDRWSIEVNFDNLVAQLTHSQIEDHFSAFGELRAILLRSDPSGTAEVVFNRHMDAIKAMNHFKDNPIHGQWLTILEYKSYYQGIDYANGKLILTNLDSGITFSLLIRLFAGFGGLVAVVVHHDLAGKALGTAHVVFELWYCALEAMRHFNGASIDGRLLQIQLTTSESDLDSVTTGKLIVANLDYTISLSDISKLFSQIGILRGAAVHYYCGSAVGTAEVHFTNHSDAIKAKQHYNGFLLKGRPMQIQLATSGSDSVHSGPNKLLIELDCWVSYSHFLKIFTAFGKLRALSVINRSASSLPTHGINSSKLS